MSSHVVYRSIVSAVGPLLIAADTQAMRLIEFSDPRHPYVLGKDWLQGDNAVLRDAEKQLKEYFRGERRQFELPLAPQGTDFQRRVWWALAQIPFGQTLSYGALAQHIGKPAAVRAVGAA